MVQARKRWQSATHPVSVDAGGTWGGGGWEWGLENNGTEQKPARSFNNRYVQILWSANFHPLLYCIKTGIILSSSFHSHFALNPMTYGARRVYTASDKVCVF